MYPGSLIVPDFTTGKGGVPGGQQHLLGGAVRRTRPDQSDGHARRPPGDPRVGHGVGRRDFAPRVPLQVEDDGKTTNPWHAIPNSAPGGGHASGYTTTGASDDYPANRASQT